MDSGGSRSRREPLHNAPRKFYMSYERHPIGACYPDLTVQQYATLKAGLRDPAKSPAILFEGKILDGWHYYKACLEESVEPRFETPEITDPYEFVVRRNEGRRHLNTEQNAVVAERMAVLKHGSNQFTEKVDGRIRPSTFSVN